MNGKPEFQTGVLHVLTHNIYFFMVSNFFFIMSIIISLAWFFILERSLLDIIPLILIGPALTAIFCFMIQFIETDRVKEDLPTFSDFTGYYKKNFKDSLKIWVPFCTLIFILSTNIMHYQWGDSTIAWGANIIYLGLIMVSTLVFVYMLIINAKFKFRVQDLIRLSCYYVIMKIKITAGIAGIIFLTLVVMYFYSEFLILFVASPMAYLFVKYSYSILEDVEENFIQKEE